MNHNYNYISAYITDAELERKLQTIMELGIPVSNIKIHPNYQEGICPELIRSRQHESSFKVLGAFVGTEDYVKNSLNKSSNRLSFNVSK